MHHLFVFYLSYFTMSFILVLAVTWGKKDQHRDKTFSMPQSCHNSTQYSVLNSPQYKVVITSVVITWYISTGVSNTRAVSKLEWSSQGISAQV